MTIENLDVQLNTNFTSANTAILGVVGSLQKLSESMRGFDSGRFGNSIRAVAQNANALTEDTVSRWERFARTLMQIGSIPPENRNITLTTRSMDDLGKSSERTSRGLSKLFFMTRRALYLRLFRNAITALINSMKDGWQHMLQFSIQFNSLDISHAYDTANAYATAWQNVKNSAGAAWAQIAKALLPAIQSITAWLVNAINKVNMFFAAWNGCKQYMRVADDYTVDVADNMKRAAGHTKEMLKDLMGFDEINRLSDPTKGWGSGGTGISVSPQDYVAVDIDKDKLEQITAMRQEFEKIKLLLPDVAKLLLALTFGGRLIDTVNNMLRLFGGTLNLGTISLIAGIALALSNIELTMEMDDWIMNDGECPDESPLMWAIKNVIAGALIGSKGGAGGAALGAIAGGIVDIVFGIRWGLKLFKDKEEDGEVDPEFPNWFEDTFWNTEASQRALSYDRLTDEEKEEAMLQMTGLMKFDLRLGQFTLWLRNGCRAIRDFFKKLFGISDEDIKEEGGVASSSSSSGTASSSVDLEVNTKKGLWDSEAWQAVVSVGKTVIHTLSSIVKKGATWIADAWEAVKMTTQTVVRTVTAAIKKADTWIDEAWQAAKMKAQEITRTVYGAVTKAVTWVSEAWQAANMKEQEIVRTVKASLVKAVDWVSDAWEAAKMKTQEVTRTVTTSVVKAVNWVNEAYIAAQMRADNITRLVQAVVQKAATWVAEAWEAVKTTAGSVTRTVYGAVQKASTWVGEAWEAVKTKAGTVTTTVKASLQKASTWVQDAWDVIKGAGKEFIINAKLNLESKVDSIKQWINENVIDKLNEKLNSVNFTIFGKTHYLFSKQNPIPRCMASGGIINNGLFIAGEAGPELIGSQNGSSVVMNNEQIVDAVSAGVYKAVSAAMSGGGKGQHIEIKIGSKTLFDAVVTENNNAVRRIGSSPLLV